LGQQQEKDARGHGEREIYSERGTESQRARQTHRHTGERNHSRQRARDKTREKDAWGDGTDTRKKKRKKGTNGTMRERKAVCAGGC